MSSPGSSDEFSVSLGDLESAAGDADFFRSLVEHGSDAIISVDEASRIIYANRSVERVFGYEPEELIGEPLTTIMPERFHAAHFESLNEYLESGERTIDWTAVELPAQHKEGHEIPLSITFEEHQYDGDRVFSGIMRDISAQREHEENLKRLQSVTRDLMEISDEERIAERIVETAQEVLEFPIVSVFFHDESAGRLRPVAHSDAVARLLGDVPDLGPDTLAWESFQAGEPREYQCGKTEDVPVYRPDGPIESEYVFPLADWGCLLVSATEKRALGDRERSLTRILAANAEAALERAEREAERERLERFASVVSHDLREPIQTARATAAVAEAGDESAFEDLDAVFDRMERLIEDVLVLAKRGQAVGETEPVDLRTVAEEAWTTVDVDSATLSVTGSTTLSADPERLRTLFENLMSNAVEHAGPAVTVTVEPTDDGFAFADDGPGFGDVDTDRLFEYGYSTESDNTGFGLNIVGEIVDAHGWTIEATTGADGGARFEVESR